MEIGIDSFVAAFTDKSKSVGPVERMQDLLEDIEVADKVGLDIFGIGEHHRKEFLDSAPPMILSAAAARTKKIRLTSAVTVLSATDPVRTFQEFATLDLISRGRAEMVVGRGSFVEAFPLFGYDLADYDRVFREKLDLLLKIRDNEHVTWSGVFRPALTGQGVYPRPLQDPFPIWLGVGGTPGSFVRAGLLGLPLAVAIIGGETHRFRPLVDSYMGRLEEGWPSSQGDEGGVALSRLRRRLLERGSRRFLPRIRTRVHRRGEGARLGSCDKRGLRRTDGTTGCPDNRRPRRGDREDKAARQGPRGISRVTFQMDPGSLSGERFKRSIELLGKRVAPAIHKEFLEEDLEEERAA